MGIKSSIQGLPAKKVANPGFKPQVWVILELSLSIDF